MRKALACLLVCALALGGCVAAPDAALSETEIADAADMFKNRDRNAAYDERDSAVICLNGDTASCDDASVQISGSAITITGGGTYILIGALQNGSIAVNAGESDKAQIVLNGATIHSETSAALYVLQADKVIVTLAEGSQNALTNGGAFVAIDDNNIDGAVFSKEDLSFNGAGSLTVDSPAGHGIVCKDDLVFTGGAYQITAASHGIDANDSVRATAATFAITAGKDGIHAENEDEQEKGFVYIADGAFDITAGGDGISAGAYLWISGGDFHVVAGGGSASAAPRTSGGFGGFGGRGGGRAAVQTNADTGDSTKGLKATGDLIVEDGAFRIDAANDGLHANASISIRGGTFSIAAGDDGFHADDTLTIAAGQIDISQSYEGLEGLHVRILGGDIRLSSSDDGLNAAGGVDESGFGGAGVNDRFGGRGGFGARASSNGSIEIAGGSLYVSASGDGIDANGTLEISGGAIVVSCPVTGDTAVLDYDVTGIITGGTFIGTGAVRMAQTFGDSAQGVIAVNVGDRAAGTRIALSDEAGVAIVDYTTDQRCAIVILSAPDIVKGEMYTLAVGADTDHFAAY